MTGVSLSRVENGIRVVVKDGDRVLKDRVFPTFSEAKDFALAKMTEACRAADAR